VPESIQVKGRLEREGLVESEVQAKCPATRFLPLLRLRRSCHPSSGCHSPGYRPQEPHSVDKCLRLKSPSLPTHRTGRRSHLAHTSDTSNSTPGTSRCSSRRRDTIGTRSIRSNCKRSTSSGSASRHRRNQGYRPVPSDAGEHGLKHTC
jgi:hypothetical protein